MSPAVIDAFERAGTDRVLIGLGATEHRQALEELESIAKEVQYYPSSEKRRGYR